MSLSPVIRNALMKDVMGLASYTAPTDYWVSLHTGDPGATGGDNELPLVDNYARVNHTVWVENPVGGDLIQNDGIIQFATPAADWGDVTHCALFDAVTGGEMIARGVLTAAKFVNTGDDVEFPSGTFKISLTSGDGI